MGKDFLSNVYGYHDIKRELYVIQQWYKNQTNIDNKKKYLPRGILFHGLPGQGKTHIVREYAKSFKYPIFVIEGDDKNILKEINDVYIKAKKSKQAIVVIDELDRLIEDDSRLIRALMSLLDGFKESNVLTLATANDYYSLPDALLREGRFDRHFHVEPMDKEDLKDIISHFASDIGIDLSNDALDELFESFHGCRVSLIKMSLSDAMLRYGNKATCKNIIDAMDFLKTGIVLPEEKYIPISSAIHEAGHAIYIYRYSKNQKFLRIIFNNEYGATIYTNLDDFASKEHVNESIDAAIAGIVGEHLILTSHDIGVKSDMHYLYDQAYRLISNDCVLGFDNYTNFNIRINPHQISEYKKASIDKATIKFIKSRYKKVKKELKPYKKDIIKLANYLIEHKEIQRNTFIELLEK